jgi:hypothetical protein
MEQAERSTGRKEVERQVSRRTGRQVHVGGAGRQVDKLRQ